MGFHHTSMFALPLTLKAKSFVQTESNPLRQSLSFPAKGLLSFYTVCMFSRTAVTLATKMHFKH